MSTSGVQWKMTPLIALCERRRDVAASWVSMSLPGKDMELQLASASRLLSQKAIDGVIFHCTPLVDMDLDAVKVSRAWIKENASKKWGA